MSAALPDSLVTMVRRRRQSGAAYGAPQPRAVPAGPRGAASTQTPLPWDGTPQQQAESCLRRPCAALRVAYSGRAWAGLPDISHQIHPAPLRHREPALGPGGFLGLHETCCGAETSRYNRSHKFLEYGKPDLGACGPGSETKATREGGSGHKAASFVWHKPSRATAPTSVASSDVSQPSGRPPKPARPLHIEKLARTAVSASDRLSNRVHRECGTVGASRRDDGVICCCDAGFGTRRVERGGFVDRSGGSWRSAGAPGRLGHRLATTLIIAV